MFSIILSSYEVRINKPDVKVEEKAFQVHGKGWDYDGVRGRGSQACGRSVCGCGYGYDQSVDIQRRGHVVKKIEGMVNSKDNVRL